MGTPFMGACGRTWAEVLRAFSTSVHVGACGCSRLSLWRVLAGACGLQKGARCSAWMSAVVKMMTELSAIPTFTFGCLDVAVISARVNA